MFMFNNVPSGLADDPNYRNTKQAGNVRVEIDFEGAFNVNLTVLVWGEFENLFEVKFSRSRTVSKLKVNQKTLRVMPVG